MSTETGQAQPQLSKTDPLGHEWTYAYDGVGNKTQMVDGNGNATTSISTDGITTYGYDASDRLTSVNYSDSTPDVSYTYDLAGEKTSMTDGAGTVGYTYDAAGSLLTVIRGTSSGFSYSYDSGGRLASRQYPDGTTTSYAYDVDGRLSTVTVGSDTTGYSSDADGNVTATAYPNGWTEQRTYDGADRLSDIRSVKSGQSDLAVATYSRDAAGNPTTIVRDGVNENYGYDNADRVTGVCYGGALSTCASGSKITYGYDKVGNRLSQVKFGTTTNYFYDAGDELCWAGASTGTSCGTVPSGNTAYGYDADGQQTGEGAKTYAFDLSGKLLSVVDGSSTVGSFTYDGDGNRLTKSASSVTTDYAWDTSFDLPMLAHESQGSTVLREYRYGDRLLSMNAGGGIYYFHHDDLGSTTAITKSTAALEWTYTYDPFGDSRTTTKVDSAAPENLVQFTGELVDAETDLYNLRARMYDPSGGRFLAADPLAPDQLKALLSLYIYVEDKPLIGTDPSGQAPVWEDETGESHVAHLCTTGGWWYTNPDQCPPAGTAPPMSGSGGGDPGSAIAHPATTSTTLEPYFPEACPENARQQPCEPSLGGRDCPSTNQHPTCIPRYDPYWEQFCKNFPGPLKGDPNACDEFRIMVLQTWELGIPFPVYDPEQQDKFVGWGYIAPWQPPHGEWNLMIVLGLDGKLKSVAWTKRGSGVYCDAKLAGGFTDLGCDRRLCNNGSANMRNDPKCKRFTPGRK